MADIKNSILGLVEATSRTLAPTKGEMETILRTEERLTLDEHPNSEYWKEWMNELRHARRLLDASPDVPTFLSAMREYASGATSSPAKVFADTSPAKVFADTSPAKVFADTSPAEVFAEMQSTAVRRTVAGCTLIVAALVAGIGGYLHWPLWIAAVAGLVAFIIRDASQNFRISIDMGAGVFYRSAIMSVLMMVVIWGIGYAFFQLAGR